MFLREGRLAFGGTVAVLLALADVSGAQVAVVDLANGLRQETMRHPDRAEALLRSAMMSVGVAERPAAATALLQASFDGISATGFVLVDPATSQMTAPIEYRAKAGKVEGALKQGLNQACAAARVTGPAGGPWVVDRKVPGECSLPTSPALAVKITQVRPGGPAASMVFQVEIDHERRLKMVYDLVRVALQTEPQAAPAIVELGCRTAPDIVLDIVATALDVVMGVGLSDGKGSFKGFKSVIDPCEDDRIGAIVLAAASAVPSAAAQIRDLAMGMVPECWHQRLSALFLTPELAPFLVRGTSNPKNTSVEEEVSPSSP